MIMKCFCTDKVYQIYYCWNKRWRIPKEKKGQSGDTGNMEYTRRRKKKKNTTQYELDTTLRKQTQKRKYDMRPPTNKWG